VDIPQEFPEPFSYADLRGVSPDGLLRQSPTPPGLFFKPRGHYDPLSLLVIAHVWAIPDSLHFAERGFEELIFAALLPPFRVVPFLFLTTAIFFRVFFAPRYSTLSGAVLF